MLVWINRLVQVISTVGVIWLVYLRATGRGVAFWAWALVVLSVIASVGTQWLVLRGQRSQQGEGSPHA